MTTAKIWDVLNQQKNSRRAREREREGGREESEGRGRSECSTVTEGAGLELFAVVLTSLAWVQQSSYSGYSNGRDNRFSANGFP